MSDRTLAYVFPGCLMHEIAPAVRALGERGPVDVVSPAGGDVLTGDAVRLQGTRAPQDVDAADYACAIVPGGDVFAPLHDPAGLALLAAIAARAGTVVGGICNGAVVLGAAGLLAERRATHPVRPPLASPEHVATLGPFVAGATFVDSAVVVDGGIVTARPTAAEEFARAVVLALDGPAPST